MKVNIKYFAYLCLAFAWSLVLVSCEKFTEIGPPKGQVISEKAFANERTAEATIAGAYNHMITANFASGNVSALAGLAADELAPLNPVELTQQIYENRILSDNTRASNLWISAYNAIYHFNACAEGLEATTALPNEFRDNLLGEAKFLRAYAYFYLVNLYGDIPLSTTIDWNSVEIKRHSPSVIYAQIVADLTDALEKLNGTNKVRATKQAAAAMLARVQLYLGDHDAALTYASMVLDDPTLSSELPPLGEAFLKNSTEAIFQLKPSGFSKAVSEAGMFVPPPFPGATPQFVVTDHLLQAFEPGDQRRTAWLGEVFHGFSGNTYYYPFKYKSVNFNVDAEFYILLRLAEQYLIRAEARAHLNDIEGAVVDLNVVRQRAGLSMLDPTISKEACLNAIQQERRIELFAEWGHRWFDLKRQGKAEEVLKPLKVHWKPHSVWFPVPSIEIEKAPQLGQTTGYN